MTDKERYRELCKYEKSIPLFSKDWWMDAVCGDDNWDVLLVNENENINAAMPYYFTLKKGKKVIGQPSLAQTNGVWFNYPNSQKYSSRLSFEKEILNTIIDKLLHEEILFYSQNYYYTFTNWLPFYWRGFKQTTRYTYIIEDISDLRKVYKEFDSRTKSKIKKAQKSLILEENISVERFYEINTKTFKRQGLNIPYNFEKVKRIYNACQKRNCVKIFGAEDENKDLHSALFLVWDENSAYYLMGGNDPQYKASDAPLLLMWKAIEFSSTVTKSFNFEGSMIENIERFFRSFGARQTPYFNISKELGKGSLLRIIAKDIYENSPKLNKLFNKLRGR